MIRQLSRFVVATSESLPRFFLAAVLGPGTLFFVLFPMMRAFTALAGGLKPFDWQDELTAASIAEQLPAYSEPVRQLYFAHAFVDFVFPVFVGTFFGAIAAFALRHGLPRLYQRLSGAGMFAIYFATVPFDYCENTGILAAILTYPSPPGRWADLAVFGKHAKLLIEFAVPAATGLALLAGACGWVATRLSGRGKERA